MADDQPPMDVLMTEADQVPNPAQGSLSLEETIVALKAAMAEKETALAERDTRLQQYDSHKMFLDTVNQCKFPLFDGTKLDTYSLTDFFGNLELFVEKSLPDWLKVKVLTARLGGVPRVIKQGRGYLQGNRTIPEYVQGIMPHLNRIQSTDHDKQRYLLLGLKDKGFRAAVAVCDSTPDHRFPSVGELAKRILRVDAVQEPLTRELPAGSGSSKDGDTEVCGKEAVQVYYDPPKPLMVNAMNRQNMTMEFDCAVSGVPGSVLLDSGAEMPFISAAYAHRVGLTVDKLKVAQTVKLPNGSTVPVLGKCHVKVRIQQFSGTVTCWVVDLTEGFSLILGQSWLEQCRAVLNFGNRTCTLLKGRRRVTLTCSAAQGSNGVDKGVSDGVPKLLSAVQVKRAVRTGCETFLVSINKVDEGLQKGLQQEGTTKASGSGLQSIGDFVQANKDVFPDQLPDGLPPDRGTGHTIPLEPGSKPTFGPMYRLSPAEKREVERQVKDYLAKGFIEHSKSSHASPVIFVAKKDGTLRMCVDYRALNNNTVKNKYPLPRIDDLIDQVQGCSHFSSLDLQSGYHQIRISEEDVPKTAFRTHIGLYQFRVLSFGLCNAPATFQAVMNGVFAPYLGKFVLVYLDDILIFSKSQEEHREHLQLVVDLLRKHKLYAKLSKCEFEQAELQFLGFVISGDSVKMDPKKTAVVKDWPVPKDVGQLRSFLGMANYFRRFVKGYNNLVRPLNSLLRKTAEWEWTDSCQKAFDKAKETLVNVPVLAQPDFTRPFEVVADACGFGIGAVLLQEGRPVAFESRGMSPAECNYHIGEQELLAVVHAMRTWRCYLEGVRSTVVTDHNPITYLQTQPVLSRRQARWSEYLQMYDFKWLYRPGRCNVADPLSRLPVQGACESAVLSALGVMTRGQSRAQGGSAQGSDQGSEQPRQDAQSDSDMSDADVGQPSAGNADEEMPSYDSEPEQSESPVAGDGSGFKERVCAAYRGDPNFVNGEFTKQLVLKDGLWFKDQALVLPKVGNLRQECMRELHDTPLSGHLGVTKTQKAVMRLFWWPSVRQEVKQYVLTCHSCQRSKSTNQKCAGFLVPLDIPLRRWSSISVDLITQLPETVNGNTCIVVFVDRLSKMVHFAPDPTNTGAYECAKLFRHNVVRLHGLPRDIVSDQDARWKGKFWTELCKLCNIQMKMSTPYHPQTDGQTERANRTLEEMLRHFVNPTRNDWDEHLDAAEFACNAACGGCRAHKDTLHQCDLHATYWK